MPAEVDFLHAIIADPDADGPRLVYADWREECGDAARAEFIRAQCALATLPDGEREYHPLRERQADLLKRHYGEWFAPYLDLLGIRPRGDGFLGWVRRRLPRFADPIGEFRRGFVEELVIDLAIYLNHAAALADLAPLRSVRLGDYPADHSGLVGRLADCSAVGRLANLDLHVMRGIADDVPRLIESPHLAGLTGLALGYVGSAGVAAIANSSLLPRLERLSVACGPQSLDGLDAMMLLHPRSSCQLSALAVTGAGITSDRLSAVLPLPNLPQLVHLDLSVNPLNEDFAAVPDQLPPTISELTLTHARLGNRAAAAFAASPTLRNLRRLDLSFNEITDIGAMALADSPNLVASTKLDLRGNPIGRRVQNALRIRCGHHVRV
jgi:uncharacterized protein (TIGR02996 family)